MSQLQLRSNLSAAIVPFYTAQSGRTIVLPQYDQNYDRAVLSPSDPDKDKGIPQVFYLHNVIPTPQGFQSIGYEKHVDALVNTYDFDKCYVLRTADGNKFLYSPADGKNYVYDANVGHWVSTNPIDPALLPTLPLVSRAFINGETYIYFEKYGCFKYDPGTSAFLPVVLTALVAADIRGICGAAGYLIAFDVNNVAYWSSAIDPTDFTPSIITGAGSGGISDIKGAIVGVLTIINGFMIYTDMNVVSATYTGNIRYPFIFKEVNASAGIRDIEAVSYEANYAEHYAWTAAGIQKLDKTSATLVYPEVSSFIGQKILEDFDEVALTFSTQYLDFPMNVKLAVIGRYMIFSYGISAATLTHALIYDIAMKRWGKLKIEHVDCFEFVLPNLSGALTYADLVVMYGDLSLTAYADLSVQQRTVEQPLKTIAFLQKDGTVYLMSMDLKQSPQGVFILGKYQFVRNRLFTLQGFDVETIGKDGNLDAYILPSYDGKTLNAPVIPFLKSTTSAMKSWLCRLTGLNVSLLFVGAFNFVSIVLAYTKHGQR